jgi:hypothetical protein
VRLIAKDMGATVAGPINATNWEAVLTRLQGDFHPEPDVWITELEVQD